MLKTEPLAVVKGNGELGFSLGQDTPHNATKISHSHTMCLETNNKYESVRQKRKRDWGLVFHDLIRLNEIRVPRHLEGLK